jgi:hypothetical protein
VATARGERLRVTACLDRGAAEDFFLGMVAPMGFVGCVSAEGFHIC